MNTVLNSPPGYFLGFLSKFVFYIHWFMVVFYINVVTTYRFYFPTTVHKKYHMQNNDLRDESCTLR